MANLTMEQVKKYNEKIGNEFKFDSKFYLFHQEKTCKKLIDMGNNKVLEAKIMYTDDIEKITNEYNVTYNKYTGKKQPTLHLSLWYVDENGTGSSHGLGQWINIGELKNKSMFNYLQKLTYDIDENFILSCYNKNKLNNSRIL